MARSAALGESTSAVEVTNASNHGLRLCAAGRELFLPYSEFPWFKDVWVSSIFHVEETSPGHFYWPDLDVDLGLESIEHPKRFPLKFDQIRTSGKNSPQKGPWS